MKITAKFRFTEASQNKYRHFNILYFVTGKRIFLMCIMGIILIFDWNK